MRLVSIHHHARRPSPLATAVHGPRAAHDVGRRRYSRLQQWLPEHTSDAAVRARIEALNMPWFDTNALLQRLAAETRTLTRTRPGSVCQPLSTLDAWQVLLVADVLPAKLAHLRPAVAPAYHLMLVMHHLATFDPTHRILPSALTSEDDPPVPWLHQNRSSMLWVSDEDQEVFIETDQDRSMVCCAYLLCAHATHSSEILRMGRMAHVLTHMSRQLAVGDALQRAAAATGLVY